MRALSIRQPWAELILRGVKTIEYRSRPTRIIGERFYIYAAGSWPPDRAGRRQVEQATRIWARDLAMPGIEIARPASRSRPTTASGSAAPALISSAALPPELWPLISDDLAVADPPAWLVELADVLLRQDLPTGVILGTATIERITPPRPTPAPGRPADAGDRLFRWHLAGIERAKTPRRPERHPQPAWFRPF